MKCFHEMKLELVLQAYLKEHQLTRHPFLLALSGGVDSMALLHSLLHIRQQKRFEFHVAHVDHGWRPESSHEAQELQQFVISQGISFHLLRLDPAQMSGNREDTCRQARYAFFSEVCRSNHLLGVMLAHHANDQAETILKRLFEGAHWSKLTGLKALSSMHGIALFRPLLALTKKEIQEFMNAYCLSHFEDSTNIDTKYLRARMRHALLPWLNQAFGKNIDSALLHLGQEATELAAFMDRCVEPFLALVSREEGQLHLDLSGILIESVVLKNLLRKLCGEQGFTPSRQILQQVTEALQQGHSHKQFRMGKKSIEIHRRRVSIGLLESVLK